MKEAKAAPNDEIRRHLGEAVAQLLRTESAPFTASDSCPPTGT